MIGKEVLIIFYCAGALSSRGLTTLACENGLQLRVPHSASGLLSTPVAGLCLMTPLQDSRRRGGVKSFGRT